MGDLPYRSCYDIYWYNNNSFYKLCVPIVYFYLFNNTKKTDNLKRQLK